jgi:hypothetical protein
MRSAFAATLSVVILGLTSCGGGDPESRVPQAAPSEADASLVESPSESATAEAESVGPTDEDLRQFVELLSKGTPNDTIQALKMTSKGSVANAVLTIYKARDTASQTAGNGESKPDTIIGGDGTFQVCSKKPPCQTWTGFKAEGNLIADFTIDGKRMGDRVILGSKKQYQFGDLATARLIGSYKFVSTGGVGIYLEVNAKAAVTLGWDSDAYVGPDGAQVSSSAVDSPGTLRPGASAIVGYYFPEAKLGGDVYLLAVEDGGAQRDENITIKTG